MKKLLLLVLSCLMIAFAAGPVAAVYIYTSPFSADSVLTSPLSQGGMVLSGQLEMFSASQSCPSMFMVGPSADNPEWDSLSDNWLESHVYTVIPIRFAYGITDDIAVRLTVPYVSQSTLLKEGWYGTTDPWEEIGGGNIGDVKIEALYEVIKEDENMPSIGANLGIKLGTGTYDRAYFGWKDPSLGTGATDVSLTGVVKKNMGPVEGKALLSYIVTGDTSYTYFGMSGLEFFVRPAERFVYSFAAAYPVSPALEVGGEIWGVIADKDGFDIVPDGFDKESDVLEDTEVSSMFLSPYVVYNVMDNLALRGVIEIPISQQPTRSVSDALLHQFQGINIIVGASWTIM